jgi:hypothetical protein
VSEGPGLHTSHWVSLSGFWRSPTVTHQLGGRRVVGFIWSASGVIAWAPAIRSHGVSLSADCVNNTCNCSFWGSGEYLFSEANALEWLHSEHGTRWKIKTWQHPLPPYSLSNKRRKAYRNRLAAEREWIRADDDGQHPFVSNQQPEVHGKTSHYE